MANTEQETVTISKEEYAKINESIQSLSGLSELVKSQAATIKELSGRVESAEARAASAASAISKDTYVQPVKIPSGEHPYLSFKARVLYKQASVSGVITEKEFEQEIEMPKPCGKLNSVMSELQGRIMPRIMKEKGITDYIITGILYDEETVKTKNKKVSFVGKKPVNFTAQECEDFAIIYEAFSVPVNVSVAIMIQAVANEWAYVKYDCKHTDALVINGKAVDKAQQTIELVDYIGVRQTYPQLDAISPSRFREISEEQPEQK